MPSEFYNTVQAAFIEARAMFGVSVTFNGVTKTGISTPVNKSKDLDLQGYMPQADVVIELLRTDKTAMSIEDRSEGTIDGSTVVVLAIDDDPAEPCVRLTCKNAR